MRIAFLNAIPADVFRGGEKWMVTAASGLAARGHEVRCIGRPGARWLETARDRGLGTTHVPIHTDFDPVCISRLARLFSRTRPDILVCNFEKDVRLGGIAARIAGVRRTFVRKGLSLIYPRFRYRLTYRWLVDGIITPARAIKRTFASYPWLDQGRIHVIPNGIDIPDTGGWDRGPLRRELEAPDCATLLVGAGRLFSQKGFEYLIDAGGMLAQRGADIRIVIFGPGDPAPYLERARNLGIVDRVRFPGPRADLRRCMHAADIFVLSSIDEGLPNVVMEAMSVGTPVVAADAGGAAELIIDGESGFVVPVRDAAALADRTGRCIADPVLRSRLGAAGRERMRQSFGVDSMVDSLERLFRESLTS